MSERGDDCFGAFVTVLSSDRILVSACEMFSRILISASRDPARVTPIESYVSASVVPRRSSRDAGSSSRAEGRR